MCFVYAQEKASLAVVDAKSAAKKESDKPREDKWTVPSPTKPRLGISPSSRTTRVAGKSMLFGEPWASDELKLRNAWYPLAFGISIVQ